MPENGHRNIARFVNSISIGQAYFILSEVPFSNYSLSCFTPFLTLDLPCSEIPHQWTSIVYFQTQLNNEMALYATVWI
jgi:hypothetical protein